MRKRVLLAAAAASLSGAVAPASAHVTLQPEAVPADGFTRLDVRVPNESEKADTTGVRIQFPPGFHFVSYEPVDGWAVDVRWRELDEPAEEFGEEITEEVAQVDISAKGDAGVAPGQFRDFGLSMKMPPEAGEALTFKALQEYSDGKVVRWIGPPESDEPAPQVELTAPEGESPAHGGSGAETDAEPEAAPKGLAIAALVVGVLALALGIAALMRARRAAAA